MSTTTTHLMKPPDFTWSDTDEDEDMMRRSKDNDNNDEEIHEIIMIEDSEDDDDDKGKTKQQSIANDISQQIPILVGGVISKLEIEMVHRKKLKALKQRMKRNKSIRKQSRNERKAKLASLKKVQNINKRLNGKLLQLLGLNDNFQYKSIRNQIIANSYDTLYIYDMICDTI